MTAEAPRNGYGPFHGNEHIRAFDPERHLSKKDQKRAWEQYSSVEADNGTPLSREHIGMYGPPGTLMLQSANRLDLGSVRYANLYLFINPGLGLVQATLGLIGDGGIEIESALGPDHTNWLVQELLHPDESSWP